MSRYIDADELVKYFKDKYEPTDVIYFPYVLDDIDAQPTVDAVKVVRCKDCKYRADVDEPNICGVCKKEGEGRYRYGEDYCSYGEREEGAECSY